MAVGTVEGKLLTGFAMEDFASSLNNEVAKQNYTYLRTEEDIELRAPLKCIFFLSHAGADLCREVGVDKETSLAELRAKCSGLNQHIASQSMKADPDKAIVQEIPIQRFSADLVTTMVAEFFKSQFDAVENDRSLKELLEYEPEGEFLSEEEKPLAVFFNSVSTGERIKLHFWAVILFVEAVWRTTIEAVAYAIHLVAPTWFENYPIADREVMVQRQWQSLQLMAGAIFSPFGHLREIHRREKEEGDSFIAMDKLGKVGRGTAYQGQITATGGTSDFYPVIA